MTSTRINDEPNQVTTTPPGNRQSESTRQDCRTSPSKASQPWGASNADQGTNSSALPGTTAIGAGRRVLVLAVHHVDVDGLRYHGGAEKYILTAVRALLNCGASVHVAYSGTSIYDDLIAETGRGRLRSGLRTSGSPGRQAERRCERAVFKQLLSVERTDWINDALAGDARLELGTILRRRRWLKTTDADTVLAVQQAGGGAFAASLVAARSLGFRVVSSIRQMPEPLPAAIGGRRLGLLPSPQLWRRRLIWRRRIPALCCAAIIFNSRRVAEMHVGQYDLPRARIRIIPNGETVAARTEPRPHNLSNAPGALDRQARIATVGRLTEAKGADTLLEVFALLARRHAGVRLIYVGDGPLLGDLQARAENLGLRDRVRFDGYQRDHDAIYRNVDVYVQMSRRESMSNSVLEAMARGIPCVVADVGGLPELVADGTNGFVVPPESATACAEAISRLLEEPALYDRMSRASKDRVRTCFDLATIMQQTAQVVLGTTAATSCGA